MSFELEHLFTVGLEQKPTLNFSNSNAFTKTKKVLLLPFYYLLQYYLFRKFSIFEKIRPLGFWRRWSQIWPSFYRMRHLYRDGHATKISTFRKVDYFIFWNLRSFFLSLLLSQNFWFNISLFLFHEDLIKIRNKWYKLFH